MSTKLHARVCPFCGSRRVELCEAVGKFYCQCRSCRASCEAAASEPLIAIKIWNSRSKPVRKSRGLRNCPFCGHHVLDLRRIPISEEVASWIGEGEWNYVFCCSCLARTRHFVDAMGAIAYWNRRSLRATLLKYNSQPVLRGESLSEEVAFQFGVLAPELRPNYPG